MFIDGDTSSINRNRIHTSVGVSNWRYRIYAGVWRCDRIHTNSIVCDKVDIKKVKVKGLREIVGSFLFAHLKQVIIWKEYTLPKIKGGYLTWKEQRH